MSSTATTTTTTTDENEMSGDEEEFQDESLSSSSGIGEVSTSIIWSKALVIVFSMGQLAYLIYYYGWLWLMLKFQYEYTQWLGVPIPGPLINQQYNLQWIFMTFMAFQIFPPFAGLWMLKSPTNWARNDAYRWTASIAAVICVACFLFFFVWAWIFQNNSTFYPFSIVNDVEYCCKYWGDVAASLHCSNNNNCIDLPLPDDIYLNSKSIFRGILWGFGILLLFNIGQA